MPALSLKEPDRKWNAIRGMCDKKSFFDLKLYGDSALCVKPLYTMF